MTAYCIVWHILQLQCVSIMYLCTICWEQQFIHQLPWKLCMCSLWLYLQCHRFSPCWIRDLMHLGATLSCGRSETAVESCSSDATMSKCKLDVVLLLTWHATLRFGGYLPTWSPTKRSICLRCVMHFWPLLGCKLRHGCEHSSCLCPKQRKWKTYKSLYGAKESTNLLSSMGTTNYLSTLLLLISLNKTVLWIR